MKRIIISILLITAAVFTLNAQAIRAINSEEYNQLSASKDTLYVINHWATWCIPCVKELPDFEQIHTTYQNQPVKVILVSFDFKKQYPDQLTNWVVKKDLKSKVVWFSDQKPNEYIPKIAPEWEGNLPVTYLINGRTNEAVFIGEETSYEFIDQWLQRELKTLQ